MRWGSFCCALFAIVMPTCASAQPRFGTSGVVVVDGAADVSGFFVDANPSGYFRASFASSIDYFVIEHLSLGVGGDVGFDESRSYEPNGALAQRKTTRLGAGLRVGGDLPLADRVSFYPHVEVGYGSSVTSARMFRASSDAWHRTREGASILVRAPLLFHPTSHFFLGVGPFLEQYLVEVKGPEADKSRTWLGAYVTVGTWWGGRATDVPSHSAPPLEVGFGDDGVWVFTNAVGGTYGYSSKLGFRSLSLEPGFDYFVGSHVSLGAFGRFEYDRSFGASLGRTEIDSFYLNVTVGPRVGVDIPLARALSLYPRVTFAVGVEAYDGHESGKHVEERRIPAQVGLDVPVLLHVTTHAFMGVGPFAWRDLVAQVSFPNGASVDNRTTRVGGAITLGGWL